jgi:hypothetical protein
MMSDIKKGERNSCENKTITFLKKYKIIFKNKLFQVYFTFFNNEINSFIFIFI